MAANEPKYFGPMIRSFDGHEEKVRATKVEEMPALQRIHTTSRTEAYANSLGAR